MYAKAVLEKDALPDPYTVQSSGLNLLSHNVKNKAYLLYLYVLSLVDC